MSYTMKCPKCKSYGNALIEKKLIITKKGEYIRRERECLQCEKHFFTREIHLDIDKPKIVKRKKKV